MNNIPRSARDLIAALRRQRKAALRECGHLGEKLHTARLEIEVQRHRIKELEDKLREETFEDELDAHIAESMKDPEYAAAVAAADKEKAES
jgi:flagellar motility protein MotE (MotC chaperone)